MVGCEGVGIWRSGGFGGNGCVVCLGIWVEMFGVGFGVRYWGRICVEDIVFFNLGQWGSIVTFLAFLLSHKISSTKFRGKEVVDSVMYVKLIVKAGAIPFGSFFSCHGFSFG